MSPQVPPESGLDLGRLADHHDPAGRKAYLTIYADLTDPDWEMTVKSRLEETRRGMDEIEAKAVRLHEAFDKAYLVLERVSKEGADGAVVFMSPVHHLEAVHTLDGPVETKVVAAAAPDLDPLESD